MTLFFDLISSKLCIIHDFSLIQVTSFMFRQGSIHYQTTKLACVTEIKHVIRMCPFVQLDPFLPFSLSEEPSFYFCISHYSECL